MISWHLPPVQKLLLFHWLYPTASTLQPQGLPSFLVSIIQPQSSPFNPFFETTHIIDAFFPNGLQRFLTTLQMSVTLHCRSPIDFLPCSVSGLLYRYPTSRCADDKQKSCCRTCAMGFSSFPKKNMGYSFHPVRLQSPSLSQGHLQ